MKVIRFYFFSIVNVVFFIFIGYAKADDKVRVSKEPDTAGCSEEVGVQVQLQLNTASTLSSTCRPEITIEDIQHSNERILFYTGLPNLHTFNALFTFLVKFDDKTLGTCSVRSQTRKLRPVDEFLMVMMRLRLGLLYKDLEYGFKVAGSPVSKIFHAWICFIFRYLQSIVFLPKLDTL